MWGNPRSTLLNDKTLNTASGEGVALFTDGACSGNPGPGGWGALLRYQGHEKELSGGEAETTNNRMEMMAAIQALEARGMPLADAIAMLKDEATPPDMR